MKSSLRPRSVADDLAAVLRKIEGWHQGSIAGFMISCRDTKGTWHQVSWNGKEATEKNEGTTENQ
jgi:hypothetical protein